MDLIYIVGLSVVAIIILYLLMIVLFYKRATKEESYVRTGFGGEKVIINSGVMVFPALHNLVKINMKTMELNIQRKEANSLITADSLRVDISTNFFMRVNEDAADVSLAAQTLGNITSDIEQMRDMFEERCEAALNAVVSSMEMNELHTNKQRFRDQVKDYISADLKANGLFLQSVALTHINQTGLVHFNEDNAFDSEGLTILTQRIATNEVKRAEAEAQKEMKIREKQYNAEKDRIEYEERIIQQEEEKRKNINDIKQQTEKDIEFARIVKERDIELFKQTKERLVAEGQKKVAQIWIATDEIKAEAAKAAEGVITAKEKAQAERNKVVEIVSAEREAQRQRILARSASDAQDLEAKSAALRYKVEAEGKSSLNTAMNLLSDKQIAMQVKMAMVNQLPEIVKESVKPLENIEGIKIMQVGGLTSSGQLSDGRDSEGNSSNQSGTGGNSMSDQIVNSALRYKAQAPLVDSLLKEVGLKGSDINQMTQGITEELSGKPEPEVTEHQEDRPESK